jgi:hypothetical protein
MGFKPIRYNSGEGRAKIKLEDADGSVLGNWVIMFSDMDKWYKQSCEKFGFKKEKQDKDLDWLK